MGVCGGLSLGFLVFVVTGVVWIGLEIGSEIGFDVSISIGGLGANSISGLGCCLGWQLAAFVMRFLNCWIASISSGGAVGCPSMVRSKCCVAFTILFVLKEWVHGGCDART